MQSHLGEEFPGVISGVTEWGLYVELTENMCEGLVPVRDLADDYYEFDERNYRLVGRRHNVSYRLGDNVVVKVSGQQPVHHHVRIAAYRRCEVCVEVETQAIVPYIACAYIGKPAGGKKAKAFVYRIHDQPDATKLSDLANLAATFGYKIRTTGTPKDVNRSINNVSADPHALLSPPHCRRDDSSRYGDVPPDGSCVRYPDMMVHRLLARYLENGRSVSVDKLEEQCEHSFGVLTSGRDYACGAPASRAAWHCRHR